MVPTTATVISIICARFFDDFEYELILSHKLSFVHYRTFENPMACSISGLHLKWSIRSMLPPLVCVCDTWHVTAILLATKLSHKFRFGVNTSYIFENLAIIRIYQSIWSSCLSHHWFTTHMKTETNCIKWDSWKSSLIKTQERHAAKRAMNVKQSVSI